MRLCDIRRVPAIYIRDLTEEDHRNLIKAAVDAGKSLQQYCLGVLRGYLAWAQKQQEAKQGEAARR